MPCELILALDVPTREDAAPILRQLRGRLKWVKIGLRMFTAYGPNYVREVAGMGFDIFLDLKLHDIPHTVAKAVESLGPLPIRMLTLHTAGGGEMMRAAVAAQQRTNPKLLLLGVTVLTSMDAAGLNETGVSATPAEQVARLGKLAAASGIRGLVCSPLEVALLRKTLPADMQLVTPGIRPASDAAGGQGVSAAGDQKRIMTPAAAARAGSTHIVVGRPILQAPDPAAAATAILEELRSQEAEGRKN